MTVAVRTRIKFATQADPILVADLRNLARSEGRQIQALVDEALADLITKHRQAAPRPGVMTAYQSSLEYFSPLYRKLAE